VPKVQHKPIQRSNLGFNRKEQKKPKRTLVWCTGLSGVPPDCVRCPGPYDFKLATFGFQKSHSAIIHRTVLCATGLSGAPAEQRLDNATVGCNVNNAWTVHAEVRAAARGAPDSAQYLSGAAPECPVPHEDKAPTVETVRTLTVG
jgi:hypothetical protein